MVHLWMRAESRPNERRTGLMPEGVADLLRRGFRVSVEDSPDRVVPTAAYREAGAEIVPAGSWPEAPDDAIILGLKELPDDGRPLRHRHIMFGHAFKGQHGGRALLRRFAAGGGVLYDLEYLLDESGRRIAAFGYWAGFAGAAVSLLAWAAQKRGGRAGPVDVFDGREAMTEAVREALAPLAGRDGSGPDEPGRAGLPRAIVVGALGRVGTGAADMARAAGLEVTRWDLAETAHGGPFPEILEHEIFFNCILAGPGTPVFVPPEAVAAPRRLTVIGDIACDPDSDYNPVPLYRHPTSWQAPVVRVHEAPPLDIMAIDNLPSLLPREASADFAAQLLPALHRLDDIDGGVWGRARAIYEDKLKEATA